MSPLSGKPYIKNYLSDGEIEFWEIILFCFCFRLLYHTENKTASVPQEFAKCGCNPVELACLTISINKNMPLSFCSMCSNTTISYFRLASSYEFYKQSSLLFKELVKKTSVPKRKTFKKKQKSFVKNLYNLFKSKPLHF